MNQNPSGGERRRRSAPPQRFKIPKSLRVPFAVIVIFVVYVLSNFAVSHYRPVETTPAIQVTIDEAVTVKGYFIREEQVIDVGNANTAKYNFANGDKVATNSALITVYKNSKSLDKSQQLEDVSNTIDQLEVLQANSYVTNTSQIDQKITTALNTIGDVVDNTAFSQLSESLEQLRALALKSGSMSGDISDIDAQLTKLYRQQAELQTELEGKTKEIVSGDSGYFCQTTDGLEDKLTIESLDDLTVSSLEEAVSHEKEEVNSDQCKVISSYVWYYAAIMTGDETAKLEKDQEVTLRFAQPSDHVLAKVYDIRPDEESDEVLVIFSSTDMNSELVSMRKEVGDVVISSYSGLKVPKDAVHMQGDQMGVYILNDSVASFKKIEPVYEGADYYIVQQNIIGDDSLVIDDDIIVHAKEIDDKKVVK